jgi:hypothetical protein
LAQNDAMREVCRGRPVLGLIADLFRVSLAKGWAEACVQAFEDEKGLPSHNAVQHSANAQFLHEIVNSGTISLSKNEI